MSDRNLELVSRIRLEADRCVACGLCLPHCPTYRETRTENESPRGRIALLRALARDDLPLTPQLESHLDLCLTCRNCERVCPANVAYGRLIDSGRAFIEARRPRPFVERLLRKLTMNMLIAKPSNLRRFAQMLRLYQKSGLQRFLRIIYLLRLFGLDRWDRQLPPIPPQPAWRESYPAQAPRRGCVALFIGCVTGITDRPTLLAAIHILNRLGYDVHVPRGQVCCGALHQHGGEAKTAASLMQRNIDVFDAERVDAIISTASGCGAMLAEYADCLPHESRVRAFSVKVRDISHFVCDSVWPADTRLAPSTACIAVHDPCTLSNVLHDERYIYRLLERIPGVEVYPLPDNNLCCGAAGAYVLTQAKMANRLRANKLQALTQCAPDVITTSNIGCALHLQHGIREIGLNIEVLHPIVLIQRQLQAASSKESH